MKDTPDRRRRHLATIHAEKRRLNLTDDAYRNLLYSIAGERSSVGMSYAQRQLVIDFMRQQPSPQRAAPAPTVTCSDEEAAAILGIAA